MPDLHRPSLRFLLVEDETVDAIDLECMLEDMGHRVTAVAFGAKTVEKILARHGAEVDVAIIGMTEPDRATLAIARTLRQRGIPLAVASTEPQDTLRAYGFIEPCLEKPLGVAALAQTVEGFRKQRLPLAS